MRLIVLAANRVFPRVDARWDSRWGVHGSRFSIRAATRSGASNRQRRRPHIYSSAALETWVGFAFVQTGKVSRIPMAMRDRIFD